MVVELLTFAGDEAGDVSFRFDRGATRYFVVALIGTRQPEALREALRRLREQANLPARHEFSFHRLTSKRLRAEVWDTLRGLDFHAWAVVVDKTKLPDSFYVMPGRSFYVFFVTEAIRLIPEPKRRGPVLLLHRFNQAGHAVTALKQALRIRNIRHEFGKIRAKRARGEELIQIADLAAGALLRKYSAGEAEGYQVIRSKLSALLEYSSK